MLFRYLLQKKKKNVCKCFLKLQKNKEKRRMGNELVYWQSRDFNTANSITDSQKTDFLTTLIFEPFEKLSQKVLRINLREVEDAVTWSE